MVTSFPPLSTAAITASLAKERAFAQAERYGARLLFCERAGDVVNYYYSAPALGGGVWLEGAAVNLHVAVRGQGACIGSPLIFGGY